MWASMSVLWEGALFVAGNYLISDLVAHVCRMCQKSQAKCEVETFSLVHFLSYAASQPISQPASQPDRKAVQAS